MVAMKWILAAVVLLALATSVGAARRPILYDPVALNIGVNCQWQVRCMAEQRRAMNHALGFVAATRPPQWRVQLCNRNAGRGGYRVDWVGFDNCIRNGLLRPAALRVVKRRSRR